MIERIVLRRTKNQEELILDRVLTPDYILDKVDWGSIKGTHHTYKYVNQVGESVTNTSLETRPVEITGWIVANSERHMTILKRKLNSFVNPQETIDLYYSQYRLTFSPDDTVKYSTSIEENNEMFCKFKIVGTAYDPLFYDDAESIVTFVTTEPRFHFPLIMSSELPEKGVIFGERISSLISSITNYGSFSIGMKIVFKANGSVVNPSLINVNTQDEFKINKTLTDGEEVEVNTSIGTKRIKGRIDNGEYKNYFMYKDIDSTWLQLEVGTNLFRYNAEEGINNLDVFIYFYNKYLEVQECY